MTTTALAATSLTELIVGGGIRSVFQPIVDIDTLKPVAYEALARGPAGTPWESPAVLFSKAYAGGQVAELDWACRLSAYEAALEAGLNERTTLFVNVEPVTLGTPAPVNVAYVQARAQQRLRVVLEFTERAITSRPADILAAAQWARSHGWGIALDDVGADPGSLALLPLLVPDVVKLDLRLVQARPDREIAATMTAVAAYAERSGAALLAEGIETVEHLQVARALGARYGQGYLFGYPAPITDIVATGTVDFLVPAELPAPANTPFDVVSAHRRTRPSVKAILIEMSKHLEDQAAIQSTPAVVLSVFQEAKHFSGSSRLRFRDLARHCPLVVALGVGMGAEPAEGVRGANLDAGDPLAQEWTVVVVGAHYAAALVARDLGDQGPDRSRRFEFALTHDRTLVLHAATTLLRRVLPR